MLTRPFFILLFVKALLFADDSPVIGVLMLKSDRTFPKRSALVATSYIKWIEQSGFRWMPISMYESEEDILDKLEQLDGVILPGGNFDLDGVQRAHTRRYKKVVKTIINFGIAKNDNGKKFVIFGTCLGFEALLFMTLEKSLALIHATDLHMMRPVYFTEKAIDSSYLLNSFTPQELESTSGQAYFYFHHKHGFDLEKCALDDEFTDNFDILAYMRTTDNKDIITMVQHKRYPFIGTQFHPEKIQFEHYDKSELDRSIDCIITNQKFSLMLRHMLGNQTNDIATADLATHKYRLYYQAEYKLYDEVLVMLPQNYRPAVLTMGSHREARWY